MSQVCTCFRDPGEGKGGSVWVIFPFRFCASYSLPSLLAAPGAHPEIQCKVYNLRRVSGAGGVCEWARGTEGRRVYGAVYCGLCGRKEKTGKVLSSAIGQS